MSTILSFLAPALLLSTVAYLALRLCPDAPARLRMGIAALGLLAWAVPWPMINVAQPLPMIHWFSPTSWMDAPVTRTSPAASTAALPQSYPDEWSVPRPAGAAWPAWPALLLLPGVLAFALEFRSHRRTLRRWRKGSVDADALRELLPERLAHTPYEIRRVAEPDVAAATGLWRGTIWIGTNCIQHPELRTVLVHEAVHVMNRDGLALALATLIERVWFWNLIPRYFARQLRLFIELNCDERCAELLGRGQYQCSLGCLLLDLQLANEIVLSPAMRSVNSNVARVVALESRPRLSGRAAAGAMLCLMGASVATVINAQTATDPRLGVWEEQRSSTHFESIRRVIERAPDGRTRMIINAKLDPKNRIHVDFQCDGRSYPFLDSAEVSTGIQYSCRQMDAKTTESLLTPRDSRPGAGTRVTEVLSTDGTQLSMKVLEAGPRGISKETQREFKRSTLGRK